MFDSKLKVKRLHDSARLPVKSNPDDLGWDLYSVENQIIVPGETVAISTGIAVVPPYGYGIVLKTRSSMAMEGVRVEGGVIDPGYTGEIKVLLSLTVPYDQYIEDMNEGEESDWIYQIRAYSKIAQMILVPLVMAEVLQITELPSTDRGDKGFGSSGR